MHAVKRMAQCVKVRFTCAFSAEQKELTETEKRVHSLQEHHQSACVVVLKFKLVSLIGVIFPVK